jgi:UDP-2,3-diacylglucosamine pyrophosphatase LpxH
MFPKKGGWKMNKKVTNAERALFVSIIVLLLFINVNAIGQENLACSPTESSAKRFTVFISDLHMGVGKYPNSEKWNEMEDFRWEKEFGLFLDEINHEGGGKTDLVINGDLLELWQFVKDNCDYGDPDLGCNETDALNRVRDVLRSHEPEMQILRNFANSGQNRVYIVPGNHDAALLYDAVSKEILQKINAAPGRVCILSDGYWRSSDGLIFAEHGHQVEGDVNSYKEKWPKPFTEKKGKKYLIRTWGERFVQKYYNPYEIEYPIIDNLSKEKLGIKYAVAARGYLVAAADVAKLSKFIFFEVSGDQFKESILKPSEEVGAQNWNIKEIKDNWDERIISDLLPIIEKLLPEDDIDRVVLKRATEEGKLNLKPSDLSDNEIISLCNLRADLIERMKSKEQTISIPECPTKTETLGIIVGIFKRDDEVLQTYLQKRYDELPPIGGKNPTFKVFVYGHTHKAHDGDKYKIELPGYWVPKVFNSGAWIRVINPDQLKKLVESKKLNKSEVLPKLNPEDLPACYSFVMIKPYEEEPTAELKSWSRDSNGDWKISDPCKADK